MKRAAIAWVAAAVCALDGFAIRAQAEESFFKGKTISIVVGSTPGGAYDIISRILARRMSAYIPGAPSIIVQNMPGAGSMTAVRYLESTAPKDGTTIGVFLPGIITQTIVQPEKMNLDLDDIAWLGVTSGDYSRVCYGYGPNGVRSWADLMRKTGEHPFIMGTTGKGASNYINAASLNLVFHTNIKIIFGFPGSAELRVAVERGELDGDCGGFSSVPTEWVKKDEAHPFVRFADRLTLGIPATAVYVGSLAKTAEQTELLNFLYGADKLGRSFVMSKDVPADRLTILRKAFDRTMQDEAFRQEMANVQETVFPLTGAQAQQIYQDMRNVSPVILNEARKIYE
jgi:tripartite-type tricarboxylate transporter receptor subunit TctC